MPKFGSLSEVGDVSTGLAIWEIEGVGSFICETGDTGEASKSSRRRANEVRGVLGSSSEELVGVSPCVM